MAIGAGAVWEIRTTGDNLNGGAFDSTITGAGTDYSQQDSAQLVRSDLATSGAGSTTLTSATGGFTALMVGNAIQISSGTNFTAGFYFITGFTDANTVTLDRSPTPSGAGSGGVGRVGGAHAYPHHAAANAVDGNKIYIKAGTYNVSSTTNNVDGGRLTIINGVSTAPIVIIGYSTSRDDGGQAELKATIAGAGNIMLGLSSTKYVVINNLILNGYNVEPSTKHAWTLLATNGATCVLINCIFKGTSSSAISQASNSNTNVTIALDCTFSDCQYVLSQTGSSVSHTDAFVRCVIRSMTGGGFSFPVASAGQILTVDIRHCLFYDNAGVGIYVDAGYAGRTSTIDIQNCTFDACGSHGIQFASSNYTPLVANCLFTNGGGYGITANSTHANARVYNCAFYNNTSGQTSNIQNVTGSVALSADPYTNRTGKDFTLNNASGGGAAARGAGVPGKIGDLTPLGYMDVGAYQHPDAGGGTTVLIINRPVRIM